MKLKDMMDKDVLSFFGKYAKKVGEIEYNEAEVVLAKIAEICDIKIECSYIRKQSDFMEDYMENHKRITEGSEDVKRCIYIYPTAPGYENYDRIALGIAQIIVEDMNIDYVGTEFEYTENLYDELILPTRIFYACALLGFKASLKNNHETFSIEEIWELNDDIARIAGVDPSCTLNRTFAKFFDFE